MAIPCPVFLDESSANPSNASLTSTCTGPWVSSKHVDIVDVVEDSLSIPQGLSSPRTAEISDTLDQGLEQNQGEGGITVAVSTAFFPGAQIDPLPADLILTSSDDVVFYVHSHRLLVTSTTNKFHHLIPTSSYGGPSTGQGADGNANTIVTPYPESSEVLNVVLHILYHLPFNQYSPALETLVAALSSMRASDVQLGEYIVPGTHIFDILFVYALSNPLEIYTLAASYDLDALAVACSAHLLSLRLYSITDDIANRMGPIYLKRLFFLHLGRIHSLRRLLMEPAPSHELTASCSVEEQMGMTRAWALAAAYLTWEARPDSSVSMIKQTMQPLADKLTCALCKQVMSNRIRYIVRKWVTVKNTI